MERHVEEHVKPVFVEKVKENPLRAVTFAEQV